MRGKDFAILFALGAIWGASFLFIKNAVLDGLNPFFVVAVRLMLGAVGIAIIILFTRSQWRPTKWQGGWLPFLVIGLLNAAVPYVLLVWAESHISTGLSSILNATTPLWTVLLANYWPGGERFTAPKLVGVLIGLAGVALAASTSINGQASLYAVAAVIGMAVCYAISNLYARQAFVGTPPLFPALGQVLVGAVLVLPFALLNLPDHFPTLKASLSLLALGILGTGLAFFLYYWLLANIGSTRTSTVTYLLPMFGIAYGTFFLGEGDVFAWNVLLGLVLVLLGIAVVGGAVNPLIQRVRGVPRETEVKL